MWNAVRSARGMMSGSVEVAGATAATERTTRRRRSISEQRRIVEETFAPGASVARVARAHSVNANQVFSWRRLYQRGLLGGNDGTAALLPVTVVLVNLDLVDTVGCCTSYVDSRPPWFSQRCLQPFGFVPQPCRSSD
jgi:hypothetical protein